MKHIQIIILLIAAGVIVGTTLRPGIPEIVLAAIAALVVAGVAMKRRPVPPAIEASS
ncbi:MAG: hypothetical protein ACPGVU_07535 [Limisphaerales bacterium]